MRRGTRAAPGRAAALLAEAVFDLRGGLLAGELGCAGTEGPLDRQTGLQITMQLRKFA
jgi:hypothetical protein